ncbi:MAG TPA: transposase [Candidatus Angelobacter sp.]|jgi:transposase-like protein|nr:transposase [Candidatus Angelobacter sp.]
MPRRCRRFSKEFKLAAIEQVWGGKSVAEVAAACEVYQSGIYRWIGELGQDGKKAAERTAGLDAEFVQEREESRRRPVFRRRTFTKAQKMQVAQQVAKGRRVAEIAEQYKVCHELVYRWYYQAYPERKKDKGSGKVSWAVVEARLARNEEKGDGK